MASTDMPSPACPINSRITDNRQQVAVLATFYQDIETIWNKASTRNLCWPRPAKGPSLIHAEPSARQAALSLQLLF